jgi:hypothetical protein
VHVKVEPERWYYWCDKLGILLWQDMPNGDYPAIQEQNTVVRKPEIAQQFEHELQQMIEQQGNHPCIVMWVLFNQGWGQYDTARLTGLIRKQDPLRLIISASGWYDAKTGDIFSIHQYPFPRALPHDTSRACVIGECGGLSLVIPGHTRGVPGHWNALYCKDQEGLLNGYTNLISNLTMLKSKYGLAAAVITQLADVETELDGFTTYDRAIIKIQMAATKQLNNNLIKSDVLLSKNKNISYLRQLTP